MNGDNCFWISIRKPSDVSRDVSALHGMKACSYGPGFGILDINCSLDGTVDEEDALDVDDDSPDGGGGGGALGSKGGGGGGGASHLTTLLYELNAYRER